MFSRKKKVWPIVLATGILLALGTEYSIAAASDIIGIEPVIVDKKVVSKPNQRIVNLGAKPKDIFFYFGFRTNAQVAPIRLSCKLEGFDKDWSFGGGEMDLVVRFYDIAGDVVSNTKFMVTGESPGWKHDLEHSALTHRREAVLAPPGAAKLMVVISSAGPPSTEGVYIVTGLTVSKSSDGNEAGRLLRFPDGEHPDTNSTDFSPENWQRDGTRPTMAKCVAVGQTPKTQALAVFDNDPLGHAEWHNSFDTAPLVKPGDQLFIEWNEMYSVGDSAMRYEPFDSLPPGDYVFHVAEMSLMGVPTGVEASLPVVVPQPFWKSGWFGSVMAFFLLTIASAVWRYMVRIKVRRQMQFLERQRLLEHERLRIARDIHDDLGARVTQISLVSAMARNEPDNANKMRVALDRISLMSRDMVTALYETVWTVNPQNDNLNELGNFILQIFNETCERGGCRCRFEIEDLPHEIVVSSHIRHHLCMIVKEATNNIIKHSRATEAKLTITFQKSLLTIHLQDDGCGFDVGQASSGHGLKNMQKRLDELGGQYRLESKLGAGTDTWIYLKIMPTP